DRFLRLKSATGAPADVIAAEERTLGARVVLEQFAHGHARVERRGRGHADTLAGSAVADKRDFTHPGSRATVPPLMRFQTLSEGRWIFFSVAVLGGVGLFFNQ